MEVQCKGKSSDTTVVIPAAGGSRDVLGRNSDYPAALIRLGNRPIIFLTIEYLIEQGFKKFRIGVTPEFLRNFRGTLKILEKRAYIEYVEGELGDSPLGTIFKLISDLPKESPVLINLGDTFCKWTCSNLYDYESFILLGKVSEHERWSTAKINSESFLTELYKKDSLVSGDYAICGVFWWKRCDDLISKFPSNHSGDIIEVLKPYMGTRVRALFPEVWCDSDHGDMRENSRHRILESRTFNKIEIDQFRGIIRKTSTNSNKIIREIQYYNNLPSQLKIFFPRMVQFSENQTEIFQDLEYYSYPTLSEIYCYEDAPRFVWKRIFEKLSRITFEEFAHEEYKFEGKKISLIEVFIKKTQDRIVQNLNKDKIINQILSMSLPNINDKPNLGVAEILLQSADILASLTSPWTIIHGDFCLSNILCDLDTNNIKLIDPRGGFETSTCFGPQVYDVAKLGHSLLGRYDLIIADQFELDLNRLSESRIKLEIFDSPWHAELESDFLSIYLNGRFDQRIAKLLSGLVLLSIPSFHLDKFDRAVALLVQGLKISNEALEELR